MKAIWDWIVKAAQDIYSTVWSILSVLRDKTGKFSWKRVTGTAALIFGFDFLARGHVVEAALLLGYCAVVAIVSAASGT